MSSYVRYSMHGFNTKSSEGNSPKYEYTLTNNVPYRYPNHYFLESVFINDSITEITFNLLPEKNATDFLDEIDRELERVCFNLIASTELPIIQPYCTRELVTDQNGLEVKMCIHDSISISDELQILRTISASSIYDCIGRENCLLEKQAQYKELFWILQNPLNIIRFMALYDIMAGLISEEASQKNVHDYFGKNKGKYPFVSFFPSRKNPQKMEDSFTHLRNTIAHSKQIGVKEYMKKANQISDAIIKQLLIVISDLLCEK